MHKRLYSALFAVVLDLIDSAGQLSNLSASPRAYVNDIINMGETYILILVESK